MSNKHTYTIFAATYIGMYFSNVTINSNNGKIIHLPYGGLSMFHTEVRNQSGKPNYSLTMNGIADHLIIDVTNNSNLWIFDSSFQNNTGWLMCTPDDESKVLRNSAITTHNGIVATVVTHSSTGDELTIDTSTTSNSIMYLIRDINQLPQPLIELKM